MMYQMVFSPTGGTKKVADAFTKALSNDSILIDLTDTAVDLKKYTFKEDDICIIAVPSYGGRVPGTALEKLKQMQAEKTKAVLIAVYGNRAYEDTLLELKDSLESSGFFCVAAIAAVAEHSIMHQFAKGRPDANDRKELAVFAEKIHQKIKEGSLAKSVTVPGKKPYREYNGVPLKPKAGRRCTQCGLCAPLCPVGAIDAGNPSKTDKVACVSCMRCIAVCPQNARKVNPLIRIIAAYKMKKVCAPYKTNELFL